MKDDIILFVAGVMELADVTDSKSVGSNTVWVRVPPPAPKEIRVVTSILFFFIFVNVGREPNTHNERYSEGGASCVINRIANASAFESHRRQHKKKDCQAILFSLISIFPVNKDYSVAINGLCKSLTAQSFYTAV